MAIKKCVSDIDVVEAAKIRIKNVFANGLPIYFGFSAGKDSLVMAQLLVELIESGEIDAGLMTVIFIDEEAIFPCIEKTVKVWRKKFMLLGAKFEWCCLEVKHYNCFNQLSNDESFICWDRYKKDVWVREMPSYAKTTDKFLKPRIDSYQDWLARRCRDGIKVTGVRASESLQRLKNMASSFSSGKAVADSGGRTIWPIYDWKDKDVWLFLREEHVDIPDVYLYLWQSGSNKRQLRVSQFFSIDTAGSLVKMNEYYPGLMDRIIRREPNAYLATLYWDSEMFRRSTKKRAENEAGEPERDYKKELANIFKAKNMRKIFDTEHKYYVAQQYRKLFLQVGYIADNKDLKKMYEAVMGGDPKLRTFRALYTQIFARYCNSTKEESKELSKNG